MKSGIGKQVSHESAASDDALLLDAARCELLRRLAHTLRHDLNSPVQAALWAFELMQKGVESHPDANQRAKLLTSLDLGKREIARLQGAVRIFVSCAAPLEEPPGPFDLREVVGEIDRLTVADASLRDVHITFQLPTDTVTVTGMRAQIQLALLHLTLESLDHAGHGGTLAVDLAPTASHATVRFLATPKGMADITSKIAPGASTAAARVTESIATSHKGHVRRQQSTTNTEVEFAIARS